MTRLILFGALALLMVECAFPRGAAAQVRTVCGERETIVRQLETRYGETRRSMGLQGGRGIVEVYASDTTGSWTILVTDTHGKTCLLAAGDAFEAIAPKEGRDL